MDIIAQAWKTPGNLGALARAMHNFDFHNLVLWRVDCDHLIKEAMDRACFAKDILRNAQIKETLDYDTLIGTTSILGSDYNLRRNTITVEELAKMDLKGRVGLIIGREGDGLSNEELEACDIVVTVPTHPESRVMNVSHAATVMMYELFKASSKKKLGDDTVYANRQEKDKLMELIEKRMETMNFDTGWKEQTHRIVWKKIIGKANFTKREAMAMFGFFKKL